MASDLASWISALTNPSLRLKTQDTINLFIDTRHTAAGIHQTTTELVEVAPQLSVLTVRFSPQQQASFADQPTTTDSCRL